MTRKLLLLLLPLSAFAADVNGKWNLHLVRFGEQFAAARMELKAEGAKVTGTLNELKFEGTLDGDHLHITGLRPNGKEWGSLDGRVQGEEISGTVKQGSDDLSWRPG